MKPRMNQIYVSRHDTPAGQLLLGANAGGIRAKEILLQLETNIMPTP